MTIEYFKVDDFQNAEYPYGVEIVQIDENGELLEIIDIEWFKTDKERANQYKGVDYAKN